MSLVLTRSLRLRVDGVGLSEDPGDGVGDVGGVRVAELLQGGEEELNVREGGGE